MVLAAYGAGSSPDLQWEYWSGTTGNWEDLEAGCPGTCTYDFVDDSVDFTQAGTVQAHPGEPRPGEPRTAQVRPAQIEAVYGEVVEPKEGRILDTAPAAISSMRGPELCTRCPLGSSVSK